MTGFLKAKKCLTRSLPHIIILLAAMLSYFPTFTGEFILDDKSLVERNHLTGAGGDLVEVLQRRAETIDGCVNLGHQAVGLGAVHEADRGSPPPLRFRHPLPLVRPAAVQLAH